MDLSFFKIITLRDIKINFQCSNKEVDKIVSVIEEDILKEL
jgi:hypothetical protein